MGSADDISIHLTLVNRWQRRKRPVTKNFSDVAVGSSGLIRTHAIHNGDGTVVKCIGMCQHSSTKTRAVGGKSIFVAPSAPLLRDAREGGTLCTTGRAVVSEVCAALPQRAPAGIVGQRHTRVQVRTPRTRASEWHAFADGVLQTRAAVSGSGTACRTLCRPCTCDASIRAPASLLCCVPACEHTRVAVAGTRVVRIPLALERRVGVAATGRGTGGAVGKDAAAWAARGLQRTPRARAVRLRPVNAACRRNCAGVGGAPSTAGVQRTRGAVRVGGTRSTAPRVQLGVIQNGVVHGSLQRNG
eukprot:m.123221 g.123221  ORF g.123221 m.123221 type:complete len:301 (-) comp17278_c2_seq17:2518-3420(-)